MIDLIIRIVRLIPLTPRVAIARSCAAIFSLIPTRDRRIAFLQMQKILGMPVNARKIAELYANFGQTAAEALSIRLPASGGNYRVDLDDDGWAVDAKRREVPQVALTAHTGNWDLLGTYMSDYGLKISTIGREARNPALHRALMRIRDETGMRTIWRSDKRAVKDMLSVLQEKGLIAALIDQDTEIASVWNKFFGLPVRAPNSLVEMGLRNGAKFCTIFIARENRRHYRIESRRIPDGLDADEILALYHERLEHWIRRYPTQWVWFHKRWRSLPSGERLSSARYIKYLESLS